MFAPELEVRARQQQAGLLGGLQGQQLHQVGMLGQAGSQQQMLQQRAIDAQRGEFQRALGYGPQQIGLLGAGILYKNRRAVEKRLHPLLLSRDDDAQYGNEYDFSHELAGRHAALRG